MRKKYLFFEKSDKQITSNERIILILCVVAVLCVPIVVVMLMPVTKLVAVLTVSFSYLLYFFFFLLNEWAMSKRYHH